MKKIFIGFIVLILCACSLNMSGPKEKVKEFLDRYKNQDEKVLNDLEKSIDNTYTGDYKKRYKDLMIRQYKNMDYEVKEEIIEDDKAIVTVNIIVYNYAAELEYINNYFMEHKSEFLKKKKDDNENDTIDNDKYIDFKLTELEKVSDKKTYTINFSLYKDNNEWVLEDIDNNDIEKIHGLYEE